MAKTLGAAFKESGQELMTVVQYYLAQFGELIVGLNLKDGTYFQLDPPASIPIISALASRDRSISPEIMGTLDDIGVPASVQLSQALQPDSLEYLGWYPHMSEVLDTQYTPASLTRVARSMPYLYRAYKKSQKIDGFSRIIAWLQNRGKAFRPVPQQWNETAMLAQCLDAHLKARMFFWKRFWCLTAAAAYAVELWSRHIPARFVIGVQPFPFMAHAWVELEGKIINDQPDYAVKMAPVLTLEPAYAPAWV